MIPNGVFKKNSVIFFEIVLPMRLLLPILTESNNSS